MDNEKYGICLNTLIPLRAEASEKAEMDTQILFGELFIIEDKVGNWLKVNTCFDNYTGYIDSKVVKYLSKSEFEALLSEKTNVSLEVFDNLGFNNAKIPLVAGSNLHNIKTDGLFKLLDTEFVFEGRFTDKQATGYEIINYSKRFLNAPYLWGGRTILGIDCSGLTQIAYRMAGYSISRNASSQVNLGKVVQFIEEAQSGDLAFFDNEEGAIVHVGLLDDKKNIIHASGKVRIDRIDHQGIYNEELNVYTHKLRVIKRLI